MADELLTVRRAVRSHATLFLAQGVIITLLGVAAVIWPHLSSLAVDIFLGWVFLFSGIVGLGLMLLAPNASSFLWSLLTGALALFAGVVLLWHPAQGVVSLTLVLVAFFIVEGLFQIAAALAYRSIFPESWGWMLFSGIIDLILAGLIVAGLPGAAGWALGLIAGVNLISSGLAIIIVALTVQRAAGIVEKALR
jgi:uncharacterized membrane protein HdeD (DUF308 family)